MSYKANRAGVTRLGWLAGGLMLCCAAAPASAADKLWDNVNGGFFSEPLNWFGGVPGMNDLARFETTNSNSFQRAYTVDFTTNITNQQLVVEDDGVTFNLMGHTYELKNEFVAAAIGTVPNRSGNLIVTNGTLKLPASADLEIASVGGGSGALTVGAGGIITTSNSGLPELKVGVNGNGALEITSGGKVHADRMMLGVNSGSSGMVTVSGDGSYLQISDELNMSSGIGSGTIRIMKGGRMIAFASTIIGGNDALHLEGGTLFARFMNASGFFWTSGTLTFDRFSDDLTIPNGGVLAAAEGVANQVSGDLTLLPGATTQITVQSSNSADQIQVDGHVAIDKGNLKLSLDSGVVPSSTAKLEIITTGVGVFGSFANVANGQRVAAGNGSFLVNYGSGSPFDPTSVFISSFMLATPGDFDVDGDVDGRDFLFWQRGDSPHNGNAADLVAWKVNFGAVPMANASQHPAPEPSSVTLVAIAILAPRATARRRPLVRS